MPRTQHVLFGMTALLVCTVVQARGEKGGEQVYREVCMSCHAAKVDKAPQFGDRTAWAPLLAEGQHVLTAHAWVGVRGMPPRGGRADLSLVEFANAVAYLARSAGGDWADVDTAMLNRIKSEEALRRSALKAAGGG